jgi:hypothetical protein
MRKERVAGLAFVLDSLEQNERRRDLAIVL